jgi:hypothetical protein
MRYIPPFSVLKHGIRLVSLKGQLKVDMSYDELLELIKTFLRAVPFDEGWYRSTYPDVAEAVARGAYRSAREHFVEHGYFEGRLPFPLEVDEAWYLKAYPDVGSSVAEGAVSSALDHFVRHGYEEGRRPGEG